MWKTRLLALIAGLSLAAALPASAQQVCTTIGNSVACTGAPVYYVPQQQYIMPVPQPYIAPAPSGYLREPLAPPPIPSSPSCVTVGGVIRCRYW